MRFGAYLSTLLARGVEAYGISIMISGLEFGVRVLVTRPSSPIYLVDVLYF